MSAFSNSFSFTYHGLEEFPLFEGQDAAFLSIPEVEVTVLDNGRITDLEVIHTEPGTPPKTRHVSLMSEGPPIQRAFFFSIAERLMGCSDFQESLAEARRDVDCLAVQADHHNDLMKAE
jgi:hypothetical protein